MTPCEALLDALATAERAASQGDATAATAALECAAGARAALESARDALDPAWLDATRALHARGAAAAAAARDRLAGELARAIHARRAASAYRGR